MLAHHQLSFAPLLRRSEWRLRCRVDRERRRLAGGEAGDVVPDRVRDRVSATRRNLRGSLIRRALLHLTADREDIGRGEGTVVGGERQRSRVGTRETDGRAHLGGVRHVHVVHLRDIDHRRRCARRSRSPTDGVGRSLGDGLSGS